jgi:hypothetical protein
MRSRKGGALIAGTMPDRTAAIPAALDEPIA